uniref:Cytochrome c oxidase subunit 3 n=2 Tax=Thitarodes TaxID=869562 RepID=I6LL78_9NEOP|nr:cytochrome c oxidase subunit III [Thitarodes renzhiensis]YP_009132679.1 cytochrome c oxidase subunit III [Thitarodes gonggaensis]YP_010963443.1 cytochrome c oxidase subunit III [Thitarodes xunhuaensis]ADK97534.1 cytochrome c oxidase subunit III [Thitarodes renzhiensis]AKA63373.1 cytochrome c oxidase subunit III [Thitarodes gonggaensis]WNL54558.1 cytochrome c oxidase subunit 3 [Thitarodes xunhuaensis]
MMNHQNHPYHLVDFSPWPLTGAIGVLIMMLGLIKWFHQFNMNMLLLGYFIIILTMYQWWRDMCREGTFQGKHTILVSKGLQWGMILFIISEVFFFLSFFWAFFHSSLSPNIEIGMMWPPLSIISFNPFQIPLLNTIILLTSGITVTWAHHALMENNFTQSTQGLFFTVILGIYFTILQMYEYYEASFTIADSIYGSTFFMATGFHGLHVIIGTIFLMICLLRHINNHFSMNHHFGFEAAAWYWHFVDVVWLFLYISLYWWGM